MFAKEYAFLLKFDELPAKEARKMKLIKPVALYISKTNKLVSQAKLQTIMASVEKRLDDCCAFQKYISSILIFLGLLGTFWGLSHTIGNVANIIDNLGIAQSDAADAFLKLKDSLKIPLAGMGIAFGCSLFGLSASLVLGFLLSIQRKAADDFLDKIEEWLTKHTVNFEAIDSQPEFHGQVFSMALLEKTIETVYVFQNQLNDLDGNRISLLNMQKEISTRIAKLSEALIVNQDVVKTLGKNQLELQAISLSIAQKMTDGIWKEMLDKLNSIDSTLMTIIQDSTSNNERIIEALGKDIRLISKTLSSLIR
ncbi:hypothetical protein FACS1894113_3430 [Alphaproteobacteria bacterium]|nr:hypothetical protein FACS1894113_3430 [Alphaproteobacteria bacterium]